MSYRIRLNNPKWHIELWDETPIWEFRVVKWTENEEYPEYIVDKQAMKKIILFYQQKLKEIYKKINKSLIFINELFGIFSFFDLCFYRYAQEKNTAIRKSHYHLAFAYHSKNGNIL